MSKLLQDLNFQSGAFVGYFEFNIGELWYFVVFDAPVVNRSTEQDRMLLDCGERVVRHCHVGYDVNEIRSSGKRSHEMEADSREDDWLDLDNVRLLLGL